MKIFRNTAVFVVAYLLFMLPTYILPYFGSNSTVLHAFSAAMGLGFSPQWWAHVWSLVMLAMITWVRGRWIGKNYLPIFPVLAGVFDMFPILSAIPLVPTVFHVVTLIVGVMASQAGETDLEVNNGVARKALAGVGMMTLAAIGGTLLFVISAHKRTQDFEASRNPFTAPAAMSPWSMAKPKAHTAPPVAALPASAATVVNKPAEPPAVAESKPAAPAPSQVAAYKSPQVAQAKTAAPARSKPKRDEAGFTTLDKVNMEIDHAMDHAK